MEKQINQVKPTDDLYKFLPIGLEEVEFSPEQIPQEYRPTFKIKQFTKKDKLEFTKIKMSIASLSEKMARQVYDMGQDFTSVDDAINNLDVMDHIQASGERLGEVIRKYILGWSNFKNLEGEEFKFKADKKGVLQKSVYNKIPSELINLITEEILKISGLSEAEERGLKS